MTRIIWIFLLWGVSIPLGGLALNLFPLENLEALILRLYDSPGLRASLGATAALAFLGGVLLLRWTVRQHQRERIITFRNPDGEVTVALKAIEDFVRQLGCEQEGIEALRVLTSVGREGVLIDIRTSLWSTCQIPETTERLQGIIRAHVHDILGVEEPVTVRVHVWKVMRAPKGERAQNPVPSAQDAGQHF